MFRRFGEYCFTHNRMGATQRSATRQGIGRETSLFRAPFTVFYLRRTPNESTLEHSTADPLQHPPEQAHPWLLREDVLVLMLQLLRVLLLLRFHGGTPVFVALGFMPVFALLLKCRYRNSVRPICVAAGSALLKTANDKLRGRALNPSWVTKKS